MASALGCPCFNSYVNERDATFTVLTPCNSEVVSYVCEMQNKTTTKYIEPTVKSKCLEMEIPIYTDTNECRRSHNHRNYVLLLLSQGNEFILDKRNEEKNGET